MLVLVYVAILVPGDSWLGAIFFPHESPGLKTRTILTDCILLVAVGAVGMRLKSGVQSAHTNRPTTCAAYSGSCCCPGALCLLHAATGPFPEHLYACRRLDELHLGRVLASASGLASHFHFKCLVALPELPRVICYPRNMVQGISVYRSISVVAPAVFLCLFDVGPPSG